MPVVRDLAKVDALIYTEAEMEELSGASGSSFVVDAVEGGIRIVVDLAAERWGMGRRAIAVPYSQPVVFARSPT